MLNFEPIDLALIVPHFATLCRFEQDDGFGNLIAPPRAVERQVRLFIWDDLHFADVKDELC